MRDLAFVWDLILIFINDFCKTATRIWFLVLLIRIWLDDKTFVQEEKSSASRKLIQPDLLAMSQLLNFDEVRQPDCGRDKQIIFVTQEDEASDSEEEVPEVAAIEDKREERSGSLEGGTTLNLTLEEVRHIRTALTRAELEVSEKIRRKLGHS